MITMLQSFIFCVGLTCTKSDDSFFTSIIKESVGHYRVDTISHANVCMGTAQNSTRLIKVNWHNNRIKIEICSEWYPGPFFKCTAWVDSPLFLTCTLLQETKVEINIELENVEERKY